MTDTDMKEVEATADGMSTAAAKAKESRAQLLNELRNNIGTLEKSVTTKESRLVARALRFTNSLRKKLTAGALLRIIQQYFPADAPLRETLVSFVKPLQSESRDPIETDSKSRKSKSSITPEVQVYIHLLVTLFLIDSKNFDQARSSSDSLIQQIHDFNRRTLDLLAAKCYFFYSRSYELSNRLPEIRGSLLAAHRTACLRHDEPSQATLTTLLLHNYLSMNHFDQADKFRLKSAFPESASSNQCARYFYYTGRILSVQLQYSSAYSELMQALRKAPQNSADGFRITVQKLACIVQLLMGDIPERSIFYQKAFQKALRPYFQLTQAVRVGDLAEFNQVMERHHSTFVKDNTYTLIARLRTNVIKTGLRKISLSYSRISLRDIAAKLHLDSIEDTECIVAKAILDGVIDTVIDHDEGYIRSRETLDVYTTDEPQNAFHKRIGFCLEIHNESIRAMRFPPDAHKQQLESPEERRERIEQEQQLAADLAEEDDEEFM